MTDTEADLLTRCRAGDQAAWRELVARYTRRVFGVAYRFSGRVDEAEDLTQQIFMKVYQGLDRYRETEGAFPAWLSAVARNESIDYYRRRREEALRRSDDQRPFETTPSGEDSPLRTLEKRERAQLVHSGLRSLPHDLREAVVLCDLEGLGYEEIAGLLGIPLGTVKSRINRGRLELARRLLNRPAGAARTEGAR